MKLNRCMHMYSHIPVCDVIYENLPYGGTNSVLLDQLFSHVCHSFMVEITKRATKMLAVNVQEQQIS